VHRGAQDHVYILFGIERCTRTVWQRDVNAARNIAFMFWWLRGHAGELPPRFRRRWGDGTKKAVADVEEEPANNGNGVSVLGNQGKARGGVMPPSPDI